MEKSDSNKKQYLILLALSVITTFLVPVACSIFSDAVFLKNPMGSFGAISNIDLYVTAICGYIGDAILIFAAIRYRFELCLPFAFAAVFANITGVVLELVVSETIHIKLFSFYFVLIELVNSALPFAFIGIAKVFAKHMKKEAIAVAATFFGIIIVELLVNILLSELNILLVKIPGGFAGSYFDVFVHLWGNFLRLLRDYLFAAVVYLVLKIIFTDNRREKFLALFKKTKSVAKKGWDSTAK